MTDSHDPWSARVDFAKILDDIAYMLGEPDPGNPQVRLAVSQERLAAAIGFPRGTIRNWLDGSEPRHFDGEQLLAHWCRLTGSCTRRTRSRPGR